MTAGDPWARHRRRS